MSLKLINQEDIEMMNNEENLKIVEKLIDVINESGNTVVNHYVDWYIYSSIIWGSIGIAMLLFAKFWKAPEDMDIHPLIIRATLILIGVLLVGCNLPDLLAPHGIAIHQLLRDIT